MSVADKNCMRGSLPLNMNLAMTGNLKYSKVVSNVNNNKNAAGIKLQFQKIYISLQFEKIVFIYIFYIRIYKWN